MPSADISAGAPAGEGALIRPLAHSHAGIYVADIARSVAFYRDVLGFDLRYDSAPGQPGDRVVIGLIAGLAVELVRQSEFDVAPAPLSADGMGIANLSFSVADLDAAHAALLARGLAGVGAPVTLASGVRLFLLRDPDGNLIELLDLLGHRSVAEMMPPAASAPPSLTSKAEATSRKEPDGDLPQGAGRLTHLGRQPGQTQPPGRAKAPDAPASARRPDTLQADTFQPDTLPADALPADVLPADVLHSDAPRADAPSPDARPSDIRPSDAPDAPVHWPAPSDWAALSVAVGGRLIDIPAFPPPSGAELGNPNWISDQPGGTQTSGWLDAWSPRPSARAIRVATAADVAAGLSFARRHALRIAVRGTGHSYLGTSNAEHSLLLWTRAMNTVTLHDGFVPLGCEGTQPLPAVSAGAGAVWADLYHAVTVQGGRYVQGGGCMSVGVAGLVQGGGFGIFSKKFGTAASSLIEAEIVTADGQARVVNAQREPDLFWAIRGGGGGTFGVLTRLTLRTHDLPAHFGSAVGQVQARSDAAFYALIARFMGFYRDALCNPHWGDHVHFGPDNAFELAMVCQGLDAAQAHACWRPFFDWIASRPEDFTVTVPFATAAVDAKTWWDTEASGLLTPEPRPGSPAHRGWSVCDQAEVGVFLHGYDSVWLPASLLGEARQGELAAAIHAASRHQMVRLQLAKGLAGAPPKVIAAARETATNPAVLDAFTLAVVADGQGPAYPGQPLAESTLSGPELAAARLNARAIDRAIAELRKVAPEGGSYVSESNYFNRNWRADFWGVHYARLLEIKRRYDPDNLFSVHHGVGSEDHTSLPHTSLPPASLAPTRLPPGRASRAAHPG